MFLVIADQRFNPRHITTLLPHPLHDGQVNVRFVNGETLTVTTDEADWIDAHDAFDDLDPTYQDDWREQCETALDAGVI